MKKIVISICFLFVASMFSFAQNEIADGVIRSTDIFNTSMTPGVACFRIPSIVTAKNGDLIASIDERVPSCGDLAYCNDINIVVRRSKDNGKTWGEIETAVDFPIGQSASDPSMVVDGKTGDIFMFYNFMDLDKEKGIFYFHVVKSENNGKTWSKPVDITEQIAKPEWKKDFKFITSGRGCYTSDGKLLHTIVRVGKGVQVFGSDDHGKTWYVVDAPAVNPADESKIIELADGRWMINSRVNGAGKRYSHISSDQGKTWKSKAEPKLIDPSCNGSIIRYTLKSDGYDKNRLIFSNAASTKGRENLTVRISYDEGETWSEGKVIYAGTSAYSDLSVLKNGDLAVFFEKDGHKKNEVVVFSLEWMTDGEDKYSKPKRRNRRK